MSAGKRLMDDSFARLSLSSSRTMSVDSEKTSSGLSGGYVERHPTASVAFAEAKGKGPERRIQITGSNSQDLLIDLGEDGVSNKINLPSSPVSGETGQSTISTLPGTLSEHDINNGSPEMPQVGVSNDKGGRFRRGDVTPFQEPLHPMLKTPTTVDISRAVSPKISSGDSPLPVVEEIEASTPNPSSTSTCIEGEASKDSDGVALDSFASSEPETAKCEKIHIPKAVKVRPTRTYPPGITFTDVPREAKVQDILSLIRKTSGSRIRLINLKHKENAGKLFFVDWPAHEAFLNDARSATIQSPWDADLDVMVVESDIYNPSVDGEYLEDATRILRIRNLPEGVTLDIVLEDLVRSSPTWLFCIEKAILFRAGENHDVLTAQINFTSIRGAVMARDCLEKDPDNVTKYEFIETIFAPDECSLEYDPPSATSIVDYRGITKASRLPIYLLGNGYIRLPRVEATPQPSYPIPQPSFSTLPRPTRPAPPPTRNVGPAKSHPDPPKYPPNGIHIKGLPGNITYATLLSVIRGGKVFQANIFNPKATNEGVTRSGAIFFIEKEVADKVLAYLTQKGGLWISDAENGSGNRYVVSRYVNNNSWIQPAMPPFISRSVSVSIEDKAANKKFTTASVWNMIIQGAQMSRELETMWEVSYAKSPANSPPIPMRRLVLSFISISMATAAFQFLRNLEGLEGRHVARYEDDPCIGSVEDMS